MALYDVPFLNNKFLSFYCTSIFFTYNQIKRGNYNDRWTYAFRIWGFD